jgi:hypothetical protein
MDGEKFQIKVVHKIKTHLLPHTFLFFENPVVYYIITQNMADRGLYIETNTE